MINTNKANLRGFFMSVAVFAMTLVSISAYAVPIHVTGVVRDVKGEPIIGANITEVGTTNGTITDMDGGFVISCEKNATLQVSYLGYKTQEVRAHNDMVVLLKEDVSALDEVVVVGYGTQKKANLTGAVTSVDVERQLAMRPNNDIARALQGAVPGLTITNSSGKVNGAPTIQIRGVGTLSNDATSNPLVVVDGVPMDDISYLNANDIESVSVLKDAASTSIYGTRAAFGVLLITTKGAKKQDKVTVNYSNNFSFLNPTVMPEWATLAQQGKALGYANKRNGADNELFSIYLDEEFQAKADAWLERHNGQLKGYSEMIYGDDYDENGYYAQYDMNDIMFRSWRPAQNHNLSVAGSSEHINYYLSFGYDHQESIWKENPDKLSKYNVNANISSDITKWLQVGARFQYNRKDYDTPALRQDSWAYMWRWGSTLIPYGYAVANDGKAYDFRNAIAYRKQAGNENYLNQYTRMNAFMVLRPFKGFSINADFTYNIENSSADIANLPATGYGWGKLGLNENNTPIAPSYGNFNNQASSYVVAASGRAESYAFNAHVDYDAMVNNAHHFHAMAGANVEEYEFRRHYSEFKGLLDPTLPEFTMATGDQFVNGNSYSSLKPAHTHWGTVGFFARFNYDWKGIVLLELNGRVDGSSRFPAGHRWAFFPSGSVGYRMSEQDFWEPIKDAWSNFKLRASFGQIGNQAIGSNMFVSTISSVSAGSMYWLGSGSTKVSGYNLPSVVDAELTWERIQTTNIGADFGFLSNDLNVSFDWFQRNTKDMLAPAKTLPAVLGASAPKTNAGELRTRGWELSVSYNHIFKEADNLGLNVGFNLSDHKTVVLKWDNDNPLLNSHYSGEDYGAIWGFESAGKFTVDDFTWDDNGKRTGYAAGVADQSGLESGKFVYSPGDMKFVDQNNDGKIDGGNGTIDDHGDLVKIGNLTPRYQYGIRVGLTWRGFDFDMYFQGIGQRQMWQTGAFITPQARGTDGYYAHQLDYYGAYGSTEGTEFGTKAFYEALESDARNLDAFYPMQSAGAAGKGKISVLSNGLANYYPQSQFLLNAAYCRLKNLTLGYTIPQRLTRKAYIEKLRVYFTAENVCELFNGMKNYPVDPEVTTSSQGSNDGNGYYGRIDPMNRTLSCGLQITF
ncbi:MAG: TonB-dependent receptor [Paludibacteraceae bacterium]|nr:TonB-dependent receptor [Paludibacteraceae bacterium]